MPCTHPFRFHFCALSVLLALGCGNDDKLEAAMNPVEAGVGSSPDDSGAPGGGGATTGDSDAGTGGGSAGGADAGAGGGSDTGTRDSSVTSDAASMPADAGRSPDAGDPGNAAGERFSFFVTSEVAIVELSGNPEGFGGDLRHGETGDGAGLRGADKICAEIAERSMPGAGAKQWRAFLSAAAGGANGAPVHARDRIGAGPWYDRQGRLIGNSLADLLSGTRPSMADMAIRNDLPNETGTPNSAPDGTSVDNHDTLTGSDAMGRYASGSNTCMDWTSSSASTSGGGGGGSSGPSIGHSWPRNIGGGGGGGGGHWVNAHRAGGCGRGINTANIASDGTPTVGSGGGYGGFYCFALTP